MQTRVTAILVAQNGAGYLESAIAALQAQTRTPDALVVVDVASTDSTSSLLAAANPTQFVSAPSRSSLGAAIALALRAHGPAAGDEWLWILTHETAPAPDALAVLLGAVEIAPSVAIAGPKLMRWDDASVIESFGQSITRFGETVQLVSSELDQAQHDRQSDILAVAEQGMLVRRSLWSTLGGFDPGLAGADAALDLCIRARLAGHRVVAVPAARVASVVRPPRPTSLRSAQLHRRLVYSPPAALALHWLSLVPLALARSLRHLVAKRPAAIPAEFAAAFAVAFDAGIGAARRGLARRRTLGWGAIAPLRIQPSQARELAANREQAAAALHDAGAAAPQRPSFFSAGGAWVVLLLAAVGIVGFLPFLGASALTGGGLLPLASSVAELWNNPVTADPFSWVLAVLGSLVFWAPQSSVVALYLLALPLAGLAAWACAARFSARGWAPAVAAVLWALAPPFLASLSSGHLGAVIAHLLLPWLVLAVVSARQSWSAAGAASILLAATVASAPTLAPALLVGWVAWLVRHPRSLPRLAWIPIPTLVLFAPLVVQQLARGSVIALAAEPGLPVQSAAPSAWQLALASPAGGSNGWTAFIDGLGLSPTLTVVIVAVLLAPLAALAILAVFLPGSRRAIPALALALLGFATAVACTHLELSHVGSTLVSVWPGAALSLYLLGLAGAAAFALESLGRLAVLPSLLTVVTTAVLSVPLLAAPLAGIAAVQPSSGRLLPAYVTAESATKPGIGTLELRSQADGSVAATLHRGAGTTLDEQATLDATATALSDENQRLALLAGNLAAHSGFDVGPELEQLGISFVLVPDAPAGEANTVRTRTTDALDSNGVLIAVGETANGYLWRYGDEYRALPQPGPSLPVVISLSLAFGVALLLAIPTGIRRRRPVTESPDENPADTFEEDENA